MKNVAILCFVFALFEANILVNASIASDVPELAEEEAQCVTELNLDRTVIESQNNLARAPENDENFAKFLSCYYKKMDWQDADGKINYENYNDALMEAALTEVKDEDPVIQMGVRYIALSMFTDCEKRVPVNMTPENTVVWLQNCIVDKLNAISQRRK